ncbi:site-specific tyrosine recombinase/integron integrase [Parapedobacter tibetensis]|uniref:site-specific tyrosine recombinase/integron integrase n=1 Tax=Parapedobacter tibetensis TaxID=2972951 RepID=UPI00214D4C25|nr:site-specific tyrosine recombinase/integron integrase [Parapedobacter tibetensis]
MRTGRRNGFVTLIRLKQFETGQFKAQINEEIANASQQLFIGKEQIVIAKEALELTAEALNQRIERQKLRTAMPFEVFQAQRFFLQAQLDYLQAVSEYNKAHFALKVARGGTYSNVSKLSKLVGFRDSPSRRCRFFCSPQMMMFAKIKGNSYLGRHFPIEMARQKQIILHHEVIDNKPVALLRFPFDRDLMAIVKTIPEARWQTRAWAIPSSDTVVSDLLQLFKGMAWLDYSGFKPAEKPKSVATSVTLPQLTLDVRVAIDRFSDWMRSKLYSDSTVRTYTGALQLFLRYLENKPLAEIGNEDLEQFVKGYIIAGNYSASFQNQVVNGVKLFFRIIQNKKLDPDRIHRPKTPKLLPNVLSKEEVKEILEAHRNVKHKIMLSLIYACGLRRSELLNLKIHDVDSKRHLLIVRRAKGQKDRVVPLSDKALTLLRDYYRNEKPLNFLFEGDRRGEQYSGTSLQKVLKSALEKAKIKKPVTLHWLRHSYATHLLENGTDLRYIQEILGQKSSKTTEIYTHVSTKSIQRIKSPFDDL